MTDKITAPVPADHITDLMRIAGALLAESNENPLDFPFEKLGRVEQQMVLDRLEDPDDRLVLLQMLAHELWQKQSRVKGERAAEMLKVSDLFSFRLHRLEQSLAEVKREIRETENAVVKDHPWTGKRVFRMESTYATKYSSQPNGKKRVEGIVHTFRNGDEFRGQRYTSFVAGDPIVRLLLKNGNPGVKAERLVQKTLGEDKCLWTLVEEEGE